MSYHLRLFSNCSLYINQVHITSFSLQLSGCVYQISVFLLLFFLYGLYSTAKCQSLYSKCSKNITNDIYIAGVYIYIRLNKFRVIWKYYFLAMGVVGYFWPSKTIYIYIYSHTHSHIYIYYEHATTDYGVCICF